MEHNKRIIVALDYDNADKAIAMVHQLDPARCRVKIGKELFTYAGPDLVRQVQDKGFEVFLDLKFHDIPNTVRKACAAAADLGVWMLTVHASGGEEMMLAAREGVAGAEHAPKLVAVTVLTSMQESDLSQLGISRSLEEQVMRLASLSQQSKMDGVVCSAKEVVELRKLLSENFALVTPGIRPSGSASGDQKRVMTPREAIQSGSNYLVVGRPITQARNPEAALNAIFDEINAA
ncbi:orotidine 5'-phosphate decarboxylase [Pseudohongiella nitratireducens]|uniref:Orotidine 5'-phosphate decarboxylase n=1 Tax=Pseudohongiella nitratireducens TaxID=1768907 RepID=A0A917LPG0_9GAMM|nr:orotidine 5'-phosphate decarboxylase [Pseudohongiella nitratireducens]